MFHLTPESDIGKLQRFFLPLFQFFENGVLPADDKLARKLVMEESNFEIIDQVLKILLFQMCGVLQFLNT